VFAFALGLISEKTYRDLQILREIRNEFAHFSESVSFDTPSVRDRCRELSWSSLIPSLRDKSGRTQYRVALKQISGEIVGKALELTPGVPAAGKALENLQRQRESRPER
jgi:DNA-binding MltR family transcriptional regulator